MDPGIPNGLEVSIRQLFGLPIMFIEDYNVYLGLETGVLQGCTPYATLPRIASWGQENRDRVI